MKSEDRLEIQRLAEEAGREIMKIYRSVGWTAQVKADQSPLTQADLVANEIIVKGLARISRDPIVSEESDPQSVILDPSEGRRFWLVDPLDGTRDFVARLDTFVVCIALIENIEPIYGLIHSPVTDETWWAEKGVGTFTGDGKKLIHPETRRAWIAGGSRSMPSSRMTELYEKYGIGEVKRMGSALKFCRLAEGEIDVYPRFGPTSEWDTAAGQIIAEEAGCSVIDLATGERLRYGKPSFLNAGGFVASQKNVPPIRHPLNGQR